MTSVSSSTENIVSSSYSSELSSDNNVMGNFDFATKLRQLKDRMWVRETLEDLTAAEFAISLEPTQQKASKKKSSVDFEALVAKLIERVEEMCTNEGDACLVDEDVGVVINDTCFELKNSSGMGSVVYTYDQRKALLCRIIATKSQLEKLNLDDVSEAVMTTTNLPLDEIRSQLSGDIVPPKKEDKKEDNVNIYVREDGTIDWDGALQDRAALKQFGSAVWARINGMNPEIISDQDGEKNTMSHGVSEDQVTAKIIETESLKQMIAVLDQIKLEYEEMKDKHTALLNSAVSVGAAVANINLASIDPSLRAKIRASTNALQSKKLELTIQSLNYELERIFTYLEGEMGNTFAKGYIPLQDRLNVAEFGLLESQMNTINKQVQDGITVDEDILTIIVDQMTDLKRRLGIDYYVTGFSFDRQALLRFLVDAWTKAKKGAAFYVKGCQLLWNDLVYCTYLFGRALQGYTLKPREVQILRRTIRDVITFIPVVIILIFPLTPIGHVLVFGAIQRFFPGFFPTCFSESRQNLFELYESTEYSEIVINETFQEKLVRASEAFAFFLANFIKNVFVNKRNNKQQEDKSIQGNDSQS